MQRQSDRDQTFLFSKHNRIYLSCMQHCFKNFSTELSTEEKVCLLKCNDQVSDLLASNLGHYKNILLLNFEDQS